jgi:hypothetical protein
VNWAAAVALSAVAFAATAPRPAAPAKRCLLRLDSADRNLTKSAPFNNDVNVNYDVAGNVHLRCLGQKVFLDADSVSVLSGDYARFYGHVVYRDTTYRFAADTMIYILRVEKVEARGNVVALEKSSGSTLKGPYLDYWRQVKGVNDSARVEALKRPTVRYFTAPTAKDTAGRTPYILIGAHLKGFGSSRLSADSAVTLDRDSVHAEGDSLAFERGKTSVAQLMGKPARFRRAGADSFVVLGREIRFLLEDDKLKELHSFLDADVKRGGTDVAGDTIAMSFTTEKLALTLAWNRKSGATLHSGGYDAAADSLAVETPAEQLREIRLFKQGIIQNPRDTSLRRPPRHAGDTATADTLRNSIWGERVNAHFGQVDSAGILVTRIRGLESYGTASIQARSLFARTVTAKDGKRSPSINYTRADTILMQMRSGDSSGVAAVQAYGHVLGLQQETASKARPSVDTSKAKADTGKGKVARPKGGP